MGEKKETKFRRTKVLPFLKTLRHTYFMAIQQLAFVGDPDYVLCVRGKFVALELKASGEKPRKIQMYKLSQIEKTGGIPLVADPDNWEEISSLLLRMDKGECKW